MNKVKKKDVYFANLHSGMLVATFFALWLAVYFEQQIEDTLAYILILSFGILHGANDIKLLQVSGSRRSARSGFLRILIYYVFFVLAVAGLFYVLPGLALALFVVFSAYHFGEQHWVAKISGRKWEEVSFYTAYGLLVLFMLFAAHPADVSEVVKTISGYWVPREIYAWIAWGLLGVSVLLYLKIIEQYNWNAIRELFYLMVFYIIFNTASLLWAFAIYFIFWHALPSLSDQVQYLYGDFSKQNMVKYLKTSILYWSVSVLSLVVAFYLLRNTGTDFVPFLFSFLAAITFPHVFVIRRLNEV